MRKICPFCNKEFDTPLGRYEKTYCSSPCRKKAGHSRRQKRIREETGMSPSTVKAKQYMKEGRCRRCGKTLDREGTLCQKCVDQGNKFYVKWRRDLRQEVIQEYGGVCVCCGESNIAFLSMDHINDNGKEHREEIGGAARLYTWLRKNGYPKDNFQVLCHNCNWAKAIYGVCPHQLE